MLATLDPLIGAVTRVLEPPVTTRKAILIRDPDVPSGKVASDEGRYYIRPLSSERFSITGAFEELLVVMHCYQEGEIYEIRRRSISQSKVAFAQKRAIAEFCVDIEIQRGMRDFLALREIVELANLEAEVQPESAVLSRRATPRSHLARRLWATSNVPRTFSSSRRTLMEVGQSFPETIKRVAGSLRWL